MVERLDGTFPLLEYIRALENKDNRARAGQVLAALEVMGIKPSVYECPFLQIKNIVVDFLPQSSKQRLLFSAHYDVVKGSPGANDNASGVSVLLGLCRELRYADIPARIVFFDREEAWFRTPVIRLGLLGSLWYVFRTNLRGITAVYNLEFCGSGDFLAIWPIKSKEANLPALKEVEQAAARLALPFKSVHIPWPFISSDHLSFRLLGFKNALTLSLLPGNSNPLLEALPMFSLPKVLTGRRPILPEPLSFIHSSRDTSANLSENSLSLMLSLLLELVQDYRPQSAQAEWQGGIIT
jgi:Zn-dependent M28 family amino/carboxypeptidase